MPLAIAPGVNKSRKPLTELLKKPLTEQPKKGNNAN
jgi:hypothetical protein